LNAVRGHKEKIEARGLSTLLYGRYEIDLSRVEQLVDIGQTRAIGLLIRYYAERHAGSASGMIDGLRRALEDVDERGLDLLPPWKSGDLARPRLYEAAAALNRIRRG
jgi:predicted ABC-class ATPase